MRRWCILELALLCACSPRAANTAPVSARPALTADPTGPTPAFIVMGTETTVIVPVQGAKPVERRAGIWVQLPDRQGVRVGGLFRSTFTTETDADLTMPPCASDQSDNACIVRESMEMFGYVHADSPQRLSWSASPGDYGGCDCLLVDASAAASTGQADRCDPQLAPRKATAVVGGTLFRTAVWSNDGCSDVRVLDALSDTIAVLPGARPITPPELSEPPSCRQTQAIEVDWIPVRQTTCQLGDEACAEFCFHDGEAEAVAVRRGELVHVTGSASAEGGTCSCTRGRALAADACPSPVEPCGDPAAFDGLRQHKAFWVATDGRHALAGDASELSVVDNDGVVRSVEAPAGVLGVHFVDDARTLLDLSWRAPKTIGVAPPLPI